MREKRNPTNEVYLTDSLPEAAAISIFHKPIQLKDSGNRILFEYPSEAEKLAMQYRTGKLKGSFFEYARSLQEMKDLLFSLKRVRMLGRCA